MKKTLIAIAALAATGAFAQSTVTIDGLIDAGYADYNYKGTKVSGVSHNLSGTSQINFRGTSDLGGGLKASFRVETDFSPMSNSANTGAGSNWASATAKGDATAAGTAAALGGTGVAVVSTGSDNQNNGAAGTFGNGELYAGIAGGFGDLRVGANNHLGGAHIGTSQPFGTAIGGGYAAAVFATPLSSATSASYRNDNTLSYASPVMSGFQVQYVGRKQQASSSAYGNTNFNNAAFGSQQQSQISQVGLNYSAGPLVVQLSKNTEDATNTRGAAASATAGSYYITPGLKGVQTNLAAKYDVNSALTIMGGVQGTKQYTAVANSVWRDTTYTNVAAKYVTGVNTFLANVGRLSAATVSGKAATATASVLGLGYEYALSKTTSLVARYESVKDDAATALVAMPTGIATGTETSRTRMGLGMRMAF